MRAESGAVVCVVATFAAIQEGHYTKKWKERRFAAMNIYEFGKEISPVCPGASRI